MKKPPDPHTHLPLYRTLKLSLKHILKSKFYHHHAPIIQQAIQSSDKIIFRAQLFFKAYLLHLHHHQLPLPHITPRFITTIFKMIYQPPKTGRPPDHETQILMNTFQLFYNHYFKPVLPKIDLHLQVTHLTTILEFAAQRIVTNFETNIQEHYHDHVETYVEAVFDLKSQIQNIQAQTISSRDRRQAIQQLKQDIKHIVSDLLNLNFETQPKSDSKYHDWIRQHKPIVLPSKSEFTKNLVSYDLQSSTKTYNHCQDYLLPMIRMSQAVESTTYRMLNVCPIKTSFVPQHFQMDTTVILRLFYNSDQGLGTKSHLAKQLKSNKNLIWDLFFRTRRKAFRHRHYRFDYSIQTDGVSASLQLIRKDADQYDIKTYEKKDVSTERYITDLSSQECQDLKSRNVIGIDPNMGDLLHCVREDHTRHNPHKYRYTQDQRRQETKAKKYRDLILKWKNETIIKGQSVTAWESSLSLFNSKTVDLAKFQNYIKVKIELYNRLQNFYANPIFRKLRLNNYWNTRKSEQGLIRDLKSRLGKPDDVIIGIGDWEQSQHRKYLEPVKGKGFRMVLKKAGYQVFLVDEFRTSLKCSECQSEDGNCVKFRRRQDPNRKRRRKRRQKGEKVCTWLVHGLLKCQICNKLWNRDTNSGINIGRIAREILEGKERPSYLSRTKKKIGLSPMSGVSSTNSDAGLNSTLQKVNVRYPLIKIKLHGINREGD